MKLQLRQGEMMREQDNKKEGGRERKARNPKEKLVNSDPTASPFPCLQADIHLNQSFPLESSAAVTCK